MDVLDLGSVPTIGGATILLVIIGVVTRLWTGAEQRHNAEMARVTTAHAAELARVNKDHDAELAEARSDVAALRTRVEELSLLVDTERRAKWKAEDAAAEARRGQIGGSHAG